MSIKIKPPIFQEYVLEKSDTLFENTGTPTMIKVRQATRGENEQRNQLFAIVKKEYYPDRVTFLSDLSMDDVYRREVFLTMASCNIEDSAGQPLFQFKDSRLPDERVFEIGWAQLPTEVAEEIIEKVHELNQQWTDQGN